MRLFIEHSRNESPFNGKHNVYLAKFSEHNYEPCITIEYVFTSQDLSELETFNYFTVMDRQFSFNELYRTLC